MNKNYQQYLANQRRRTRRILQLREKGTTLKSIGIQFGITKQRVKEILDREAKKLCTGKDLTQ